jgi:hypothetical protein
VGVGVPMGHLIWDRTPDRQMVGLEIGHVDVQRCCH